MKKMTILLAAVTLLSAVISMGAAWAEGTPSCLDGNGNVVNIDNNQVINWEQTTKNQFLARGHVTGQVIAVYPDATGHAHFAIQIGSSPSEKLEVVYDLAFGGIPQIQLGMNIEACGDYITSNSSTQQYAASPCGAIIHWVHLANVGETHPSGFLAINGQVYGQDLSQAGPSRGRH